MLKANPLQQLEEGAKQTVRTINDWAYQKRPTKQAGLTDPAFERYPLDVLKRAAYNNVFGRLFVQTDDFPWVTPIKTLQWVVGTLENNMFPTGTKLSVVDNKTNELLQGLLQSSKFNLRAEKIVSESALMGYSGLRTVWSAEYQKWIFEVKPKEYLVIESAEGLPEQIIAVGLEWPIDRLDAKGRTVRYWAKERWTNETYERWVEKKATAEGKPLFKPDDEKTVEPNTYEEIPITIIPHFWDPDLYGTGVVQEDEVLTVKSLIRLRHKRHFGHLKFMDPAIVRINHVNPEESIDLGIGGKVDIRQSDPEAPTDLKLLEYAGMPESVKDEMYDLMKDLYSAAGLKPPSKEEVDKAMTNDSGVALRLRDRSDAETIKTLRDNGYSEVLRHYEKVLRMGARLNLPDYRMINPDDKEAWSITAKFPDFFPPTPEEVQTQIFTMKAAKLPPELMAPKIAELFGIEDEQHIKMIQESIQAELDMQEAAFAQARDFNA